MKIIKYINICFITIIIISLNLLANNVIINGKIDSKDENNEPIIGATIKLSGTHIGSLTDKNGNYAIKRIPEGKYDLIISSVGYKTISVPVEISDTSKHELVMNFKMEIEPVQSSTIVVTASKNEEYYNTAPVKVSVIDNHTIQSTSSENLRQALQFQPAVRTEIDCQNCGFSQVRLNGLEGKYSQILIDGKSIFSALNGVYGLDQIPEIMVQRVEVVRGGGSSLYGGNAIAGVVNVITKDPCLNEYKFDLKQNYMDSRIPETDFSLSGSVINDDQNLGMFFWGNYNQRNPYDANGDGYSDVCKLIVQNFGAKSFYKPTSKDKITLEAHSIYHFIRGGDSLDLPPYMVDIAEQAEHRTLSSQVNYEHLFGNGNNKVSLYFAFQNTDKNSYQGANKDINAYGITKNKTYNLGVQWTNLFSNFMGEHLLTFGYDYNNDWMNDEAPAYHRIIDQTSQFNGVYVQDDWSLNDKFNFLYGLRVDKHNLIDKIVACPRFSLIYKMFDDLSFRGTISTGYRAPQAYDEDLHVSIVNGEGLLIVLAKGLKPEYSISYSGSVDYSLNKLGIPLFLSLEYFNTRLTDAFALENSGIDSNNNIIMTRINHDIANVYGTTLEIQLQLLNKFSIRGALTYEQSKYNSPIEWSSGDIASGILPQSSDKIFKTPNLYGFFIADWDVNKNLCININGIYTGPMYVPHYAGYIKKDTLVKTKSFFELNAKVSYKFSSNPNLEISLGVKNLLNSFQNDFDKGINRDSQYIYGPAAPITSFFEISIGL